VLDAGCGSGKATLVLLEALQQNRFDYKKVDAFDLTPALLDRFQRVVDALSISGVRLCQADVLALEALPSSWTD
jgi:ubiquinone/menaquinone biosynthesis C-methylase UbiE